MTVDPASLSQWRKDFDKHAQDGFVTGEKAKELFLNSKVPVQDLAKIWTLADQDQDAMLSLPEFMVLSYLIALRKTGEPVPATLPPAINQALIAPATPEKRSKPSRTNSKVGAESPKPKNPALEKVKSVTMGSQKPKDKTRRKKWAVGSAEKKRYKEIFAQKNQGGFVNGQLAVSLFTRSGLGRDELARIWALSDMDRDSQLSQQEFIIAMHLITKRVGGDELPETTPASLVESASSSTKKKVRKSSSASPSAVPQSQPAGTQSATPVLMPAATSPSQQIASASAIGALQPELPYQLQPSSSALRMSVSSPSLATTGSVATSTPGSIAAYGVSEIIVEVYDPVDDMATISALLDLDAVQAFARSLNDELRSLKLQIEKQNVLVESCKERLAFKREQSSLIDRQRSQFDRILASYTEDIQNEEEELAAIQDDIRAALDEIEHQQAQAKSPQFDINALRKQRRDINSEFQQIKTQFNKDREEHARLASELAITKATESNGPLATGAVANPDYGFQTDFDDKFDFGGSSSTASFDDFDFSNKFKMNIPGSGTMTPVSEFDSADSEVADEVNLGWMGQSGVQTPSEPNMDFFGSDNFGDNDSGWANFGSTNTSIAEAAASPAKKKRATRSTSKKGMSDGLKKQSSKKKVKGTGEGAKPKKK